MAEENEKEVEQEAPESFSQDSVSVQETDGGRQVTGLELGQLAEQAEVKGDSKTSLELIMDVNVPVSVELGRTEMPIGQILELGPGAIIELDKMASDPVDLFVNNTLIARGEVVVVDENFGMRITTVVDPKQRIRSLR
jgi:flagellar motor switch protein FliN/FliY